MLIKQILENDTRNCYEAIKNDVQLATLDERFYKLAGTMPNADKLAMESIFSEYMARVTRIAYLQGMKDFAQLHLMLKEDAKNIMEKYVDKGGDIAFKK